SHHRAIVRCQARILRHRPAALSGGGRHADAAQVPGRRGLLPGHALADAARSTLQAGGAPARRQRSRPLRGRAEQGRLIEPAEPDLMLTLLTIVFLLGRRNRRARAPRQALETPERWPILRATERCDARV